MDYCVRENIVTTRKHHNCRICGELILKGSLVHTFTGVGDDGFYTLHFHNECWHYSRDFTPDDWESSYPGDISRKEVIMYLPEILKDNFMKGISNG